MLCKVNGVKLYYEVSGTGKPLLMLHGNGEDHNIFDAAIPKLSPKYRVYAVDSRCHGQSTKNVSISYTEMAADFIGFIKTLQLDSPILYGFSDGGIIGLLIALQEPELLGKLIISGANLYPEGLTCRMLGYAQRKAATDELCALIATQPDISLLELAKIKVPTVVLAGEHDLIRREHTQLIAAFIQSAILEIIPGEDHSSYIVHSEKLYPILAKYLS